MQSKAPEETTYTVERTFLSKITTTKLISHIVQSHADINIENAEYIEKPLENPFVCSRIKNGKAVEG